jgi:hypothetical protein
MVWRRAPIRTTAVAALVPMSPSKASTNHALAASSPGVEVHQAE